MAKFFNKISIPTALDKRNTFDLSSDHVTTMDWLTPKISYFKEVIPGESLNINMETFVRLEPLQVPSFGRINLTHRAYFVPMRVLWAHWNNFITQTVSALNSIPAAAPTTTHAKLASDICNSTSFRLVESGSSSAYDICYIASSSSTQYYKLTPKGRRFIDRLTTLGIKVNFHYSDTTQINFLPVIAWWKLLNDWYFRNDYTINNLFDVYKRTFLDSTGAATGIALTADMVDALSYAGTYDQDYFSSAWKMPGGPNTAIPTTSIPNAESGFPSVYTNAPTGQAYLGSGTINQFAIDSLKHLSDFLKRYQLAGSRAIDRYLARFGVNLEAEKINRVQYLGSNSTPISIGDVMQTSAVSDASPLGDFAGKGIGYGNNGKYSFSSDEFGYIMIVSQITPKIGYVQGIDRCNLHVLPQDFYTAEFDSLGSQAIASKEILCSPDANLQNAFCSGQFSKVFGYIPRYAEYKVGHDRLSGDYLHKTMNEGADSWYTFRNMPDDETSIPNYSVAGSNFISGGDKDQFNRIFSTLTPSVDHFRLIMHFDVKASLPMSTLFDNYEFCENGKQVSLQINGRNNNGTN